MQAIQIFVFLFIIMLAPVILALLFLGIFAMGILVFKKVPKNLGIYLLIFSLLSIIVSISLALAFYGFQIVLRKFLGIILVFFGLFMIFKFPRPEEYQPSYFLKPAIILGCCSLIIGIFLIFF